MATDELMVRRTDADDVDAIVELAGRSLGWAGDERDRAFFRWKHLENPFGVSPGWAAFDGDRMVAFRTLLRWRFSQAGADLSMVRAVDTATDPDFQGKGLFRWLTTEAVESLTSDGVDAVFNTPNDQSRPGYLKMGWSVLGRPTLMVQPASPVAAVRMARARVAAEKWSTPVSVGEPVSDMLDELVAPVSVKRRGWSTPRTRDYLSWRYGFEPLHYRAIEVRGGHAVFRVRGRGPLREVALVEWLSPEPDPGAVLRLVRAAGDYAVAIGPTFRHGFVPLPRQGPIVTWRPLARSAVPALDDVRFSLGDIELF
ncbi:MAG: GNAT family N-acetyltransferase [Acidimicrobiales bacterium]